MWDADLFDALFQSPLFGVVVLQNGRIVHANPTVERVSGFPLEMLRAFSPEELLERVHPEDRDIFLTQYRARLAGQVPSGRYRLRLRPRTGDYHWIAVYAMPVQRGGKPASVAVLVDDSDVATKLCMLHQRQRNLAARRKRLSAWLVVRRRQLRDANTYLATVFENSHDGIGVVDAGGCFEHGNPAAFRVVGWPREDLIGQPFLKIFPPERHPYMMERWAEVQRGEGRPYETEVLTKDGERRSLLISHRHMEIDGARKYAVVVTDITRQKFEQVQLRHYGSQLEEMVAERTARLEETNAQLRGSEAALERAQALAHVGSFIWDPGRKRFEWSAEMRRIHGLPVDGNLPDMAHLQALCHPADRDRLLAEVRRTLTSGTPLEIAYRLRLADGTRRHVLARGSRRKVGSAGSRHVIEGTLQDVTRQRQMERDVIMAGQREQQRIGSDLHDSLGQELSALAMLAQALETRLARGHPDLAPDAARISEIAQRAVSHARRLAQGLTPIEIKVGSLDDELRRMARQATDGFEIPVHFRKTGKAFVHDPNRATHLFHIAREAVWNAMRHARPTRVNIRLDVKAGQGCLCVVDDGRWTGSDTRGGVGLRIMRHRADILDADLRIECDPAEGTCVRCVFPNLPADEEAIEEDV